jgi:hypothetical protein
MGHLTGREESIRLSCFLLRFVLLPPELFLDQRPPKDVWAVSQSADMPLIEHWDGTRWNVVSLSSSIQVGALHAVTALSPNDIWAIGVAGTVPLIEHWDGLQWHPVSTPKISLDIHTQGLSTTLSGATGYSISASSAHDIWAVDTWAGQSMLHWNGQHWSVSANPPLQSTIGGIQAVLALTPNDAWAVGGYPSTGSVAALPIIEHWDGQHWNIVSLTQAGTLTSLATAGANSGPSAPATAMATSKSLVP